MTHIQRAFEAGRRKQAANPTADPIPFPMSCVEIDAADGAGIPLDLAPIKARESAATPGPWGNDGQAEIASFVEVDGALWLSWLHEIALVVSSPADLAFLTHARTDIPKLIAEIERLRGVRPLFPANPKPQTYEAVMLAYEGACAALTDALAQLADCTEAKR